MSGSRWIRVDTTWSTSAWVVDLSPEARLCWIELLCYVKAHGYAGEVKRLSYGAASRLWGVTRNAVTEMEQAAMEDDALLSEDGRWVITGWGDYQQDKTAAERMRRYRQRQQQDTSDGVPQGVTGVTRNEPPTETETETNNSYGASPSDAQTPELSDPDERPPRKRFPAKPRKVAGQYDYPPEFEAAWSEYPKRTGGNPKTGAYKAWRARVIDGDDPEVLARAARHYRQSVAVQEKEGTEFVQHAATFWGPSEPWREFIEPPELNGSGRHWSEDL